MFRPLGGPRVYLLRWRDDIEEGKRIGRTIYTCGPILYGPVKNPRDIVQEQKKQDFDFVKLYSFSRRMNFTRQ